MIEEKTTGLERLGYPMMDRIDRRQHPRELLQASMDYRFSIPSGQVFAAGRVVNISRGGICFRCLHHLSVGSVVQVAVGANGGRRDTPIQVKHVQEVSGPFPFECGGSFLRSK